MSKKIEILPEILKTTKDKTLSSILFNLKMVPTFSLVINSTYEPLYEFIHKMDPSLSADNINGLIVAATVQFVFKSYDRIREGQKLKFYLETYDLNKKLPQVKDALNKIMKISGNILRDMGYTVGTITGIVGFSFILQPILSAIAKLMGANSDFTLDNIYRYVILGVAFKGALTIEQLINTYIEKTEDKDTDHLEDDNIMTEREIKTLISSVI